ncbi:hypothetical protein RND81_04G133500 [Saponaria officinalis]
MDVRVGLVVLIAFAGIWVSDAKNYAASEDTGYESKIDLCSLCENYVAVALDYLKDDKTENVIVEALYNTCSQMQILADQCTMMVDEYAKTFFSEVSSMQPEGLCKKVGLCTIPMASSLPAKGNKCDVCHQAVDQVLNMLNDPDNELGIIERLLKACNAVGDKYKSQCKRTVFEYGPVFLVNSGIFVEKLDVCTTFHACTRLQVDKDRVLPLAMIEMVTSS